MTGNEFPAVDVEDQIAHKAGNPDGTTMTSRPKIVAEVRADIDDLTTGDVLARARHYFGLSPQRYQGRDPGTPRSI